MLSYITGSHGFIGSHLFPRIQGDVVALPHALIQKTNLNGFDFFYFCSSYGNLASQEDEFGAYEANVIDVIRVLEENKQQRFRSFVYLSTSSVMLKQQTVYSRSKRAAEELLLAHMERNDLPICIIRPFSVTGVGEQSEHLLPTLVHAAKTGEEMTLAPTPTHDFIDIDDVVDGIVSLAEHKARGIYQLGTGIKTTNFELLKLVEKVTGKSIKATITDSPMRPYDNENWVSNNFRARSFGWLPKKPLEQTIKEMYDAI